MYICLTHPTLFVVWYLPWEYSLTVSELFASILFITISFLHHFRVNK